MTNPDDELRVATEKLRSTSAIADDARKNIEARMLALNERVTELNNTWTGSAAASCLDLWSELHEESKDLLADLDWISTSLDKSAATYQTQESNNVEGLSAVAPQNRHLSL